VHAAWAWFNSSETAAVKRLAMLRGGTRLYPQRNLIDRETALRLYTEGSAWFSTEQGRKGVLKVGQYADFTALSEGYFSVPESRIKELHAVLTVVAGKVVHGDGKFRPLAPPMPRPCPGWSPVGQHRPDAAAPNVPTYRSASNCCAAPCLVHGHRHLFAALAQPPARDRRAFWGGLGCGCAF
jgi:cytosine/adenosine deaminase-related metal-dependent hydrolase